MRYRFIDTHKKAWPIVLMCGVLNVSRSGYYHWTARGPSRRALSNRDLDKRIRKIFARHKQRYGAPRITTDLLEQDFAATAPNQKWVSDISYVWTDEGWLYLAVVMDLYSRAIVGWSMNRRMTQQLVCDALTMALFRRHFPKGTIIHSDRGSQYCSKRYQRLIKNNGLRCSMGRKANCYDNAVMESFFHTLKVELVHRERYATRRMATSRIFEYIETYYNRQRKHSAIGHKIPIQFEQAA